MSIILIAQTSPNGSSKKTNCPADEINLSAKKADQQIELYKNFPDSVDKEIFLENCFKAAKSFDLYSADKVVFYLNWVEKIISGTNDQRLLKLVMRNYIDLAKICLKRKNLVGAISCFCRSEELGVKLGLSEEELFGIRVGILKNSNVLSLRYLFWAQQADNNSRQVSFYLEKAQIYGAEASAYLLKLNRVLKINPDLDLDNSLVEELLFYETFFAKRDSIINELLGVHRTQTSIKNNGLEVYEDNTEKTPDIKLLIKYTLGEERGEEIWKALVRDGYVDENGKALAKNYGFVTDLKLSGIQLTGEEITAICTILNGYPHYPKPSVEGPWVKEGDLHPMLPYGPSGTFMHPVGGETIVCPDKSPVGYYEDRPKTKTEEDEYFLRAQASAYSLDRIEIWDSSISVLVYYRETKSGVFEGRSFVFRYGINNDGTSYFEIQIERRENVRVILDKNNRIIDMYLADNIHQKPKATKFQVIDMYKNIWEIIDLAIKRGFFEGTKKLKNNPMPPVIYD